MKEEDSMSTTDSSAASAGTSYETVEVEVDGAVATITLDRPAARAIRFRLDSA